MIELRITPGAAAFARRLTDAAERRAVARAQSRSLAAAGDDRRWRVARLLWPQFTKG